MPRTTRPPLRRRLAALALSAAVAIPGLAFVSQAPASAAPLPITGGTISWGFKSEFRNYVINTAGGKISLGSSVSATLTPITRAPGISVDTNGNPRTTAVDVAATDTYRFGIVPGGTDDPATKTAAIASGGTLRFQSTPHAFDYVIDNLRVTLNGANTGKLIADVTMNTVLTANLELANLDLTSVTPTTANGVTTYAAIPASFTTAGAALFPPYTEGTALDPVTISVREGAAAAVVGTRAVTGTVRWATNRYNWGMGGQNGCLAGLGDTTIAGAKGDAVYNDPANGVDYKVGAGSTYDPATGAAHLDLGGGVAFGNSNQGGLHFRWANPELNIDAAGNGSLTADTSYQIGDSSTCNPALIAWSTPAVGVRVMTFTGGLANNNGTVTGDLTAQFAQNNYRFDPEWIASLDQSLRAFFMVSLGNPMLGVPTDSQAKKGQFAPARVSLKVKSAVNGDFDGDGTTDIAVFRPSSGTWYVAGVSTTGFGSATDVPVPGDYNGDGTTDIAVFRPSTGTWYVAGVSTTGFGSATDVPVPGDYNGDGTTDIAVFRPSTGTWYVAGLPTTQFGAAGDVPVQGDYNGDGTTDLAVFRPSTGTWYVAGVSTTQFGTAGDVLVPADYNGDGTTDAAVFRPETGTWYVAGQPSSQFGATGDVPTPGDYNGDGTTDIAVFRPSNGTWYVAGLAAVGFGGATDVPVSSAVVRNT